MRSVQEQCVQRIEAVQKEKDEAVKRFEEEKKKMVEGRLKGARGKRKRG